MSSPPRPLGPAPPEAEKPAEGAELEPARHHAPLPSIGATPRESLVAGVLLVFVSSVAFSTKAILVKLSYRYGVGAVSLLALRFGFSAPFFLLPLRRRSRAVPRPPLTRREALSILGLGVFGYYAASLCDFVGLRYISAGLERLILFVYPTLVVVMSAWFFKTKITRRTLLALGLTYGGVLLAVKTETAGKSDAGMWIGVAMIFGCALSYAAYLVGSGRLIPRIGSLRFTALAMIVSTAAMMLHFWVVGGRFGGHAPAVYLDGVLLALVCTVLPVFLLAEGIRRIGAGPSAIIGAVGPVSTIALAHVVLGEPVHVVQAIGTALVLVGATVVARGR